MSVKIWCDKHARWDDNACSACVLEEMALGVPKNEPANTAGEWRALEPDEDIESGDEVAHAALEDWSPVTASVGLYPQRYPMLKFRRRIERPEPQPTCPRCERLERALGELPTQIARDLASDSSHIPIIAGIIEKQIHAALALKTNGGDEG